ncbi:acylphosphatase [uncultured Methanoregula sp.]|uniref:acylphosphatase n=1 Tax=uncultured Methanoregula sp. TaxID=1005933 RepID=UPI002AABB65E|nr:acylphosphatase [uncultured Methanoregula sp.]
MERITAVARGKVQGVGYRQLVAESARRTGVHGEVRNMPDGSVRITGESSEAALAEFVRLIHAEGHPLIRVENLAVKEESATGEFKGFWVNW